jgi:hypothetical protein
MMMLSKLPSDLNSMMVVNPTPWALTEVEPTDDNYLTTLLTALDQHLERLATLSLAEQLAEAGQSLAHLTDLFYSRAGLLLSEWQDTHHPTEPVLAHALDDLFTQSQVLDLSDLFQDPEPHAYPADRQSHTSLVSPIDKDVLLAWADEQRDDLPEVLEIPEDEDPTAWKHSLASFWLGYSGRQVSWHDLCQLVDLPPAATFLALLLAGYPHHRQEGTEFYDNDGVSVQRLGERREDVTE